MESYDTYPGRGSYSSEAIAGLNPLLPWGIKVRPSPSDPAKKHQYCELKCKSGYYLDWDPKDDPRLQKCTKCSMNCKSCKELPERCLTCWSMSDINTDRTISIAYPDVRGAVLLSPFILTKDFGVVKDGRVFNNELLGYQTKSQL